MDLEDLEKLIANANYTAALEAIRSRREQIQREWDNAYLSHVLAEVEAERDTLREALATALRSYCSDYPAAHKVKRIQRLWSLVK
jgi:hypothetical protein